jgi:hypothetical protein
MAEEIIKEDEKKVEPVKVVLTKEQESQIFKALAHKTYKDVGYEFGIHLMYPNNDVAVTAFVHRLAEKIRKAPELWGISEDAMEVIEKAIASRSIKNNPAIKSDMALQEESFRDRLDGMRDTVADIIVRKLKKYNTAKGHEDVQLRDLKDLLAMAIDKGRLLRGESTENLVKLSKIDTDSMSPEDAMKVILKAREILVEGKK